MLSFQRMGLFDGMVCSPLFVRDCLYKGNGNWLGGLVADANQTTLSVHPFFCDRDGRWASLFPLKKEICFLCLKFVSLAAQPLLLLLLGFPPCAFIIIIYLLPFTLLSFLFFFFLSIKNIPCLSDSSWLERG